MSEFNTNPSASGRLKWVDLSKGVAIFLVVFAHIMKYGSLPLPDWYAIAKFKIYLFHMPFFMFLSGYVFFYSNYHIKSLINFNKYFIGRANRLLVPFFSLGLGLILVKVVLSDFVFIEEAPSSLYEGVVSMFIHTENSPVLTIWYLIILFAFSVGTPHLLKEFKYNLVILLALSLALYFLPIPDFLYINRVFQFYPFFLLGGLYSKYSKTNATHLKTLRIPIIVLFLTSIIFPFDRTFGLLICGTLSCFAIPRITDLLRGKLDSALTFLGNNTMAIYLFNVPSIGFVKAVYIRSFGYEISEFYILGLILLLSGIFIPVAIKKIICELIRFKPLCAYIT